MRRGLLTITWNRLRAARHFRLTVQPEGTASPALHEGRGAILVDLAEGAVAPALRWRESGAWLSGPLTGARFHSATEWTASERETSLRISHLRRGDESPVRLATLVPGNDGRWLTGIPHRCGADSYTPTLALSDVGLTLEWRVDSPSDPYLWRMITW